MDVETFNQALQCHDEGRLADAERLYLKVLRTSPRHFQSTLNLGIAAYQQGRHKEALRRVDAALALNAKSVEALGMRGVVLIALGEFAQALDTIDRAIAADPTRADVHCNRGFVLDALGRSDEALDSLDRSIAADPRNADAYNIRGAVYARLKRHAEALADFERALALNPGDASACANRGGVLHSLKRYDEARATLDRALALAPGYVMAYVNRAKVLGALGLFGLALADVDQAIRRDPRCADAHSARGVLLLQLNRFAESVASCDKALALQPAAADILQCRGAALEGAQRYADAAASYDAALKQDPSLPFIRGAALYARMHACDWRAFDERVADIMKRPASGEAVTNPYLLLALPSTGEQQRTAAEIFAQARLPPCEARPPSGVRAIDRKLRIGYFSTDFRSHATAYLVAGLIEAHDRARFEILGFSFITSDDDMRQRLDGAFDRLVDVGDMADREVAAFARTLGVDIAVDLMGHNGKNRMSVFAYGAAPIQVTYLGYPGTTGAPCFDYIIADSIVAPAEHRTHFTEKVAALPGSYQINDSKRAISPRVFTRGELGLPEDGFVFCCFNNNYKLTPDVFDVWMRLLARVEGSVLWLLEGNASTGANLKAEAQKRGIAPARLVFAKRMSLPDHLARHSAADLVLDTFYYGAHTTASDALWSGVPVVTKIGATFASRVGASLLTAVGLPDLITRSSDDYESLAFALATQSGKLADVKARLTAQRHTQPLFDTVRFARNIEHAFVKMWEKHAAGLPPDSITISEQ